MIDYNFLAMTRSEYEERIRKVEMELLARQAQGQQPGALSRLLFSVGEWLEAAGARMKTQYEPTPQYQPAPVHRSRHSGRAG